jgi:hypothetical protein
MPTMNERSAALRHMRLDPLTQMIVMLAAFATSVAAALFALQVVVQLWLRLG